MADCCPKPLQVRFLSLEFLNDHDMLKDAWATPDGKPEWRNTGSAFTPYDWMSGKTPNPVSYSMVNQIEAADAKKANPINGKAANRKRMKVIVRLQITPECGCPEKCQIYGVTRIPGADAFVFKSGWILLSPTPLRETTLDAIAVVPTRIVGADLTIDWYVRSHPSTPKSFPKMTLLGRTVNRRYVTFSQPMSSDRESGVTHRRMDRSAQWVGKVRTNDHPTIIVELFKKFDDYTLVQLTRTSTGRYQLGYTNLSKEDRDYLDSHPDVLKRLADAGWSGYFGSAGAWPAADPDLNKWGAECQAICRLVVGMLHQLGSPADVTVVFVWADFSTPEAAVVKTDAEAAAAGVRKRPTGPDSGKYYTLVDADVTKGAKYIQPVLDPSDGQRKIPPGYLDSRDVGWNNFEAYVRYRYTGSDGSAKTRWYGGGIGEVSGNPVHVFRGIAEYESGSDSIFGQTVQYRRITRVYSYKLRRYL